MALSGLLSAAATALLLIGLCAGSARAQPPAQPQAEPTAEPGERIVVTGQRPDQLSRWMRAESPNFILYGRSEEEMLRYAEKLERFDHLLRAVTRVTEPAPTDKMPVYLVSGRPELSRLRRQFFAPNTFPTGYYSASPSGALLAADRQLDLRQRDGGLPYSQVWLFAEYARHFLLHHS
ncbi:MAG TPA: hypothetical protein VGB54_10445, partial [Allosphingosinicella sp.]